MVMITRQKALADLGPLVAVLQECHAEALRIYEEHISKFMPLATIGGKAATIHELIVEQARQRFSGRKGVEPKENICGGRFLIIVPNSMIIQFKKFTEDFHTTNNETDNSRAFDRQEPRDELPGLPRLTAGYKLGQYGVSFEGIFLAFIIGKHCEWWHDLNTGEGTETLPFPTPDQLPPDEERDGEELPDINRDGTQA
jgi:hypothetical protein